MYRLAAAAVILAAAAGPVGCGDDATPPARPPIAEAEPSPPPPVGPAEPIYPDTVQGLEALVSALVKALEQDDAGEKSRLLASMQLPDPADWFRNVFGPELGARLHAEHEPLRTGIGWLASHIKGRLETGLVRIRVERFDAPGVPASVGYQSEALASMKELVPLYSVRFATPDGKKTWHVWSFVHHKGTFRYVGKMRALESRQPPAGGQDPLEYRLSEGARVGSE